MHFQAPSASFKGVYRHFQPMAMILRSIGTWVKVDPWLHCPENGTTNSPVAVEAKMKYFNAEALPNVVKAMVNLYYMHTLPTLLQSAEEKIN